MVVVSFAERKWAHMAAVQITSLVGRIRGIHLFHGLVPFLVYGADS